MLTNSIINLIKCAIQNSWGRIHPPALFGGLKPKLAPLSPPNILINPKSSQYFYQWINTSLGFVWAFSGGGHGLIHQEQRNQQKYYPFQFLHPPFIFFFVPLNPHAPFHDFSRLVGVMLCANRHGFVLGGLGYPLQVTIMDGRRRKFFDRLLLLNLGTFHILLIVLGVFSSLIRHIQNSINIIQFNNFYFSKPIQFLRRISPSVRLMPWVESQLQVCLPSLGNKIIIILYIVMKGKRSGTDSSDDDSDSSNELDTNNAAKYIPVARLPDRLKTKKIVINISDTQYPVIEQVAEELGWYIQHREGNGDWDVWWTDRQITADTLFRMNLYQKVNHYPGIYVLARKNLLALNLMAMKEHFQAQYSFFPDTWIIPIQFSQFRNYYESVDKGKARTYIVKPQALSQGRGIFLTRNIQQIMTGYKYVVQRYLKSPFLIEGLKFDLRIYVLLAGTQPLRLYIYEDGLARFATQRYQEPTQQNLNKVFIHLTNYSLNKNNPLYVYNKSQQEVNVGHKRTLKAIYEKMAKMGYDVEQLKKDINDVIVKTVISGLPAISHQYRYCQPEEYENNMCFHILGFDIILTNQLKPILLEINHTPSFETSTPLDYMVKKNLVKDTLKLMRIKQANKKMMFEKSKLLVKKRIQSGKREILKGEEREALIKKAVQQRDKAEEGILGGFTKIYPPQSQQLEEKYKQMIKAAEKVHKSSDEARKKLIKEEQQKYKLKRAEERQKEKEKEKKQKKKKKEKQREKNIDLEKNQPEQVLANFSETQENMKYITERTFTPRREPKTELLSSKNVNFRSKICKPVPIIGSPVEELARFSEIMLRLVVRKQIKSQVNIDEEDYFSKVKDSIMKKSKVSLVPVNALKTEEEYGKGNFVKPKTYQINEHRTYKMMDLNKKFHDGEGKVRRKEDEEVRNKYGKKRKLMG